MAAVRQVWVQVVAAEAVLMAAVGQLSLQTRTRLPRARPSFRR